MEGVMVVIRKDGKYLLGTESKNTPVKGKWRLLGGKVDTGETLEQTVARELMEEANIKVKLIKELGTKPGDLMPVTIHIFLADYKEGILTPKPNEIGELKYFSYNEIMRLDLDNVTKSVFKDFHKVI